MSLEAGTLDFSEILISSQDIANVLQKYVERGSNKLGVELKDITLGVKQDSPYLSGNATPAPKPTVVGLIKSGMKLFDAMIWLAASDQQRRDNPLVAEPTLTEDVIPGMKKVAEAVFYCYFFLLTMARYPVKAGGPNPPKVPRFLSETMGLNEGQGEYVARICSFEPVRFGGGWIRYIQTGEIGLEARNRFGLGVAGYRLFQAVATFPADSPDAARYANQIAFCKAVIENGPTWDIHPLTRDPQVLQRRGNLNKNLSNLILKIYTPDTLNAMNRLNYIYEIPTFDEAQKNFESWTADDNISGSDKIFFKTG